MNLRETARKIFLASLRGVQIAPIFDAKILAAGPNLSIGSNTYDLRRFRHVLVLAAGKAALPMAEAFLLKLGPLLTCEHRLEGLVIGTELPQRPDPRFRYRLGSHPMPDLASAQAATEVLRALSHCTTRSLVFFLVSGGSSAMLDLPLSPAVPFADLVAFHRTLVHSGLPITQLNTLRRHISAVKGGRLAVAANGATQCTLLISDVPPSTPEIIGSGPSLPDRSTVEECRALLSALAWDAVPASIQNFFSSPICPETPKPDHPAFRKASWHTLLSSDDLIEAARAAAHAQGFHVEVDTACDEQPYTEAARYLLAQLRQLGDGPRPACLLSAGELAVSISGEPGLGGRNQQFVLHCARELARWPCPAAVLSAGSDGIDGNSLAAGAVADHTTLQRAAQADLNVEEALRSFNAYPLLYALGDDVVTGPTGNNLRDLRLFLLA